jgi:hypothetical protein
MPVSLNFKAIAAGVLLAATIPMAALAQAPAQAQSGGATVPVTVDNFSRAETDTTFASFVKEGALGKFVHERQPVAIDDQKVVRMNRDTLYSFAVFDLDAGPVTVTLPDTGKRYMMAQVIDEDEYTLDISYAPVARTIARKPDGTRYALVLVRTLANPDDAQDMKAVHALQDAIKVEQKSVGTFQIPNWDPQSQAKVRDALKVLGTTLPNSDGMFGTKAETDPVRHLIGVAVGWGGNPRSAAIYLIGEPRNNDGTHVEKLTVKDVPVDGFWSISVYDAQGFFQKNSLNAYSLNNLTAKPNADGSVTVQFGGCTATTPNCLPITKGWNYTVRLYRPRAALLDGSWKFPQPELVK